MITYTSGVHNNQFVVNFDCSPKQQTYYGVNHYVSRNDRHGIREGISLVEAWYRINGGAWISKGASSHFSVSTSSNGDKIEAFARYQLNTMGFHWDDHSYPFFYFAHNANGHAQWPPDQYLYSNYARVDRGWWKHNVYWSGWCRENANRTSSTWHSSGREYRNGQRANQGWRSDRSTGSTGTVQEYRKSIMMEFRRDFQSAAVYASGISTETGTPEVHAPWSIGDSGHVTVTYKDPYNIRGNMLVRAECGGRVVDMCTYANSGAFYNNDSRTFYIDFNSAFGEWYRGKDVVYHAWIRNSYGSESRQVTSSAQRYNARPTTPANPQVSVNRTTLYMNWSNSYDSDGDAISYCVYVYAHLNGGWVHQGGGGRDGGLWTNHTSASFNISSLPEGTSYKYRVWAWDGRIYSSDFVESPVVTRGYDVRPAQYLYPRSSVISKRPRIVLSIPDTPDHAQVTTHVKWNGVWYNNVDHGHCFSVTGSATGWAHRQVFMPPNDFNGATTIEFKTTNHISESHTANRTITHKSDVPDILAQKGEYITTYHINSLASYIQAQASAYEVAHNIHPTPHPGTMVEHVHINQLLDSITTVNEGINSYGYHVGYSPSKIHYGHNILANKINDVLNDLRRI